MSDVIIEVDQKVTERTVPGEKGMMRFREQVAYLHKPGERYPSPFSLSLGDRAPFAPGRYRLAPESFFIGKFSKLEIARQIELLPVALSPAAAAVASK